jgi:excisionase family DNA binding protein
MPDYLTPREAADLLRVSERTISRYRVRGELPFQKLGSNGVRFRREHVERLLSPGDARPQPAKSWQATRVTPDAKELPESILRPPS